MTLKDTLALMAVLRAAYPGYYRSASREEADAAARLWHRMLAEYPQQLCAWAMDEHIRASKFPPAPSELIAVIRQAAGCPGGGAGAVDAWNALRAAACRASAMGADEFAALPPECRRFCGGLEGLRRLGRMDERELDTVTQSNFLRRYADMRKSREICESMPPSIMAIASALAGKMSMPEPQCGEEPGG